MPLSKFVQSSADRQEALIELAESKLPMIRSIALELYNNPEKRRDKIAFDFLKDGYDRAVNAGVSEEAAGEQWDIVAELVDMKLDELLAVPYDERDDLHMVAMAIILAASKRQAEIESGLIIEAARIGKEAGEDLKANTKGMSRETLKRSPYHIKEELKKRKAAKKAAK